MTPERNPWARDSRDDGRRRGGGSGPGPWLWLALAVGVGGLVWLLVSIFPERQLQGTDWAQLVKLGAIVVVCSSGLLFLRRIPVGETLRNIAIWVGIGLLLLIGYAYRAELSDLGDRLAGELMPSRAVEVGKGVVQVHAGRDGHFTVTADVNGVPINFLIDTGASDIVLSPADAVRAGYDPSRLSYTQLFSTANGTGHGAPIRLDSLSVGPIVLHDLPASVNAAPMPSSLLGMSFLRALSSFEVRGDVMILRH